MLSSYDAGLYTVSMGASWYASGMARKGPPRGKPVIVPDWWISVSEADDFSLFRKLKKIDPKRYARLAEIAKSVITAHEDPCGSSSVSFDRVK